MSLILNLNLHNLIHGAAFRQRVSCKSYQIKELLNTQLKHDDNVLPTSSRRDSL